MCHMILRICRSLVLFPKRKMFLDAVYLKQVIRYEYISSQGMNIP